MNISEAESAVMELLWVKHPQSAEDIIKQLKDDGSDWQEATVKTLLNRLLKKRCIAAKKDGRRYLYRPRVARTDYVASRSSQLLDRLFGGRVAPLVAHFSEQGKLTKKDIEEMKQLIKEIERGK